MSGRRIEHNFTSSSWTNIYDTILFNVYKVYMHPQQLNEQ